MASEEIPPFMDSGLIALAIAMPAIVVIAILVTVLLLFRWSRNRPIPADPGNLQLEQAQSRPGEQRGSGRPDSRGLGDVVRSLSSTLMDDEMRIVDELARAGGELLQSDLPNRTDFSKSAVSKAIHRLEVRGIVVREKHKWTYWCKINPRLVERFGRPEPSPTGPVS